MRGCKREERAVSNERRHRFCRNARDSARAASRAAERGLRMDVHDPLINRRRHRVANPKRPTDIGASYPTAAGYPDRERQREYPDNRRVAVPAQRDRRRDFGFRHANLAYSPPKSARGFAVDVDAFGFRASLSPSPSARHASALAAFQIPGAASSIETFFSVNDGAGLMRTCVFVRIRICGIIGFSGFRRLAFSPGKAQLRRDEILRIPPIL